MATATEAFQRVLAQAEAIRNDEHQMAGTLSVGDVIRQGDVYFECIEDTPKGASPIPVEMQLAPGTTQGSRHILQNAEGVEMFRVGSKHPLLGPIIRCKAPVRVTHPEHGDWTLPAGTYRIRYQRAYAEELRRVRD